jgi:hypothetical protein
MLVHFDSSVGQFTMHGAVAIQLLKMMGHSGTVPSAILAAEIPAALARLRESLKQAPPPAPREDDDEREEAIPISRRAVPLIELMQNAIAEKADITWDRA